MNHRANVIENIKQNLKSVPKLAAHSNNFDLELVMKIRVDQNESYEDPWWGILDTPQ